MKDDGDPLPLRKLQERLPQILADVEIEAACLLAKAPCFPVEVGSLYPLSPEVHPAEIQDGLPQIRLECIRVAQMQQPAEEPNECVLDQVVGQGSVTGDEEGEPEGGRRVPEVKLGASGTLLLELPVGFHLEAHSSAHP